MYSRWPLHDAICALSLVTPGQPTGEWAERCCPTLDVTIVLSHFNKTVLEKAGDGVNERWRARSPTFPGLHGDRRFLPMAEVAETGRHARMVTCLCSSTPYGRGGSAQVTLNVVTGQKRDVTCDHERRRGDYDYT